MLPSGPSYKSVLHGPHHRAAFVDVYDIDGNVRALGVPLHDGSVQANLTNRVTRTATFTPGPVNLNDWWPRSVDDPLSPYRAVVRVFAGTRYGNGETEVFPVFTGRVYDASRGTDGRPQFRCDDLAADVVAARFEQPRVARRTTILAEVRQLISEAVPQAVFGPDTVQDAATPVLTWDEDRGQALDDLTEALGSRWYTQGDGAFLVRPFTYAPSAPVQTLIDGPGGLMLDAQVSITRDAVANSVVVVSERMDGTDPVRIVARDNTPSSPTRYGGPFGRVVQVIKVQTPLSTLEAQTLARTQLAAATALTEQWSADVVPDYTLEPGDTVRLGYRGLQSYQVIDSITYPLLTGAPMRLGTRSAIPEPVQT